MSSGFPQLNVNQSHTAFPCESSLRCVYGALCATIILSGTFSVDTEPLTVCRVVKRVQELFVIITRTAAEGVQIRGLLDPQSSFFICVLRYEVLCKETEG